MVASKLPQILQLNPSNELVFQGPFDKVVTSYLEISNPSERRVCFKVKTTAPRRYCVRPNSGIVEPVGKIKIAIMLQPMEPENMSERIKHKFMVQSTIVQREDESGVFDDIWANAAPDQIMDSKLKCTFVDDVDKQAQQRDSPTPDLLGGSASTNKRTSTASTGNKSIQQQQTSGDEPQQAAAVSAQQQTKRSGFEPLTSSATHVNRSQESDQQKQQSGAKLTYNSPSRRSDVLSDKSTLSSHNLSSSFHQSISDDKKVLFVSLIMLILGVILGKYII